MRNSVLRAFDQWTINRSWRTGLPHWRRGSRGSRCRVRTQPVRLRTQPCWTACAPRRPRAAASPSRAVWRCPVGGVSNGRWVIPRPGLLTSDWHDIAPVLAALGHPVRLRLLNAVLAGTHETAALAETLGDGTTGQLHHHLRELTATGWLRAERRGRYDVPADRVRAASCCRCCRERPADRTGGRMTSDTFRCELSIRFDPWGFADDAELDVLLPLPSDDGYQAVRDLRAPEGLEIADAHGRRRLNRLKRGQTAEVTARIETRRLRPGDYLDLPPPGPADLTSGPMTEPDAALRALAKQSLRGVDEEGEPDRRAGPCGGRGAALPLSEGRPRRRPVAQAGLGRLWRIRLRLRRRLPRRQHSRAARFRHDRRPMVPDTACLGRGMGRHRLVPGGPEPCTRRRLSRPDPRDRRHARGPYRRARSLPRRSLTSHRAPVARCARGAERDRSSDHPRDRGNRPGDVLA